MLYMYCIQCAGVSSLPTAATNGFTSSLSQAYSQSATTVQSSTRPVSARSAGTEYLHPSRSTIPPTPPTRDRLRLEPYTDRNGTRFGLVGLWVLICWILHQL